MWDSPGKNTGVAYHALLQGIFPTQGTNLCLLRLLHCRQILYCWATWEALYWRALNITMKFCTRHLDYLHAKLLQNVNKLIDHMLGRTVSLSVNHPSPHRKQNCEVKWKLFSRVWLFATVDCAVHGILQARILEWVGFPFYMGSDPGLPCCRWIVYQLSHKGSKKSGRRVFIFYFYFFCNYKSFICYIFCND